jgi:ribosome maturation factor RimP
VPEGPSAVAFLRSLPIGTRVVVRRREDDGFHDALGYLTAIDAATCTVETRAGSVTVPLSKVTRAKTVPPPPQRRAPRFSQQG